jgi:hypothetical protein
LQITKKEELFGTTTEKFSPKPTRARYLLNLLAKPKTEGESERFLMGRNYHKM